MTTRKEIRIGAVILMTAALLQAAPPSHATFPGKNGLILYGRGENGGSNAEVRQPDGTQLDSIGNSHYTQYLQSASWSPDGTKAAFTTSGANDIYIVDYASGVEHALGVSPAGSVEWSPDGKKIVFTRQVNGFDEIWVTNSLDGSNTKRLTTFSDVSPPIQGNATSANWSPDGSRIAFSGTTRKVTNVDRQGNPLVIENRQGIWSMNPDGTDPQLLVGGDTTRAYRAPDWSPDGQSIIFDSNLSGADEIYTIPAAGGAPTLVPVGGGLDPVWSPNGKMIAFANGGHIWTAPAAGGAPVQLAFCSGNFLCGGPDWAPVAPAPAAGCKPGPGLICGTDGRDQVAISEGNVETGPGNDKILVEPTDATTGITVDAGGGSDEVIVDLTGLTDGTRPDRQSSGGSVRAAAEIPTIKVVAAGGNDTVRVRGFLPRGWKLIVSGGGGADAMKGNLNESTRSLAGYFFNGGADNDKLFGSAGKDRLEGGDGADEITGGKGDDTLDGGDGKDTCFFDLGDTLKSCERKTRHH
jgi:Ca2+-binding RTX toxin-like protein